MTAQPPHGPYQPQHTGPHTYSPQHAAPYTGTYDPLNWHPKTLAPPMTSTPYVTSTPHVIRGDRNGMGVAGLVLGIIGLSFAVIPLVGVIAWVLWPLGAIFSAIGLGRANRALATNRNIAVAGLIVSMVAAAVCIAWVIFTAYATTTH